MDNVVIFKYPFETFTADLELPKGAVFLHAECQDNVPMFWFRIDKRNELETRKFYLIGTGHPYNPIGMRYLKTFIQGPFVWHLHEIMGQPTRYR